MDTSVDPRSRLPRLIQMLQDSDAKVQKEAARMLGRWTGSETETAKQRPRCPRYSHRTDPERFAPPLPEC